MIDFKLILNIVIALIIYNWILKLIWNWYLTIELKSKKQTDDLKKTFKEKLSEKSK